VRSGRSFLPKPRNDDFFPNQPSGLLRVRELLGVCAAFLLACIAIVFSLLGRGEHQSLGRHLLGSSLIQREAKQLSRVSEFFVRRRCASFSRQPRIGPSMAPTRFGSLTSQIPVGSPFPEGEVRCPPSPLLLERLGLKRGSRQLALQSLRTEPDP